MSQMFIRIFMISDSDAVPYNTIRDRRQHCVVIVTGHECIFQTGIIFSTKFLLRHLALWIHAK